MIRIRYALMEKQCKTDLLTVRVSEYHDNEELSATTTQNTGGFNFVSI